MRLSAIDKSTRGLFLWRFFLMRYWTWRPSLRGPVGFVLQRAGSQPAAGRVGRGLALARLPRSLARAPGRRGGSHVTISASPSHGWEQCSERGPRDSGRRACHPFWAARFRAATALKAPELLRAQARAVAFRDAPGFEGFPERQPHARFSSLPRSLGSWSAWG